MEQKRFKLTEEHIKLLKRANVIWDDCEFGAPGMDPKRPYGNSDVIGDMAEILGIAYDCEAENNGAIERRLENLHRELEQALAVVLSTGKMEPGTYVTDRYSNMGWKKA